MIFGIVEYSLGYPGKLPTTANDGDNALQSAGNGEFEWKLVKYNASTGLWVDSDDSLDRGISQIFYDIKATLQPLYERGTEQGSNWVMVSTFNVATGEANVAVVDVFGLSETHTQKIRKELQSMSPNALIDLYELDLSVVGVPDPIYFHSGTNGLLVKVVWQDTPYIPLPAETEGFSSGSTGALPRPKIRIANTNGAFGALVDQHNDLQDCKLTRKRTFVKYLDAVNFPDGNTNADPQQYFPDDIWFVDQKTAENRHFIEWELSSPADLTGVMLPGRIVSQNYCPWLYKGAECGYDPMSKDYGAGIENPNFGRFFDTMDNVVAESYLDSCGKRMSSCTIRFHKGNDKSAIIPFGGFPGATRY